MAQASGSRRSFGTMAKPFQVGRASQSAVMALELASRGLTAASDALEGEAGYFDLYSSVEDRDGERLAARLGRPFELDDPGLVVKQYPCGAAAHAAIDAALSIRPRLPLDDVERLVVDVPYNAPIVAHQHQPRTGLEGKFSLGYCLAAALIDGQVGLAQFTDDAVLRPDAQALLRRVETRVPADMAKGAQPVVESRLEAHLRDGRVVRAETVVRRGTGNVTPLTDAELDAKFMSCAERSLGAARAREALDMIRQMESLPRVSELTAALAAG
jgi:2-methylcitrate dehydratase PrpD